MKLNVGLAVSVYFIIFIEMLRYFLILSW